VSALSGDAQRVAFYALRPGGAGQPGGAGDKPERGRGGNEIATGYALPFAGRVGLFAVMQR